MFSITGRVRRIPGNEGKGDGLMLVGMDGNSEGSGHHALEVGVVELGRAGWGKARSSRSFECVPVIQGVGWRWLEKTQPGHVDGNRV